jgi:hypothetical protein
MVFAIVATPNHWGPWFYQTWIYIMSESSHVNISLTGSMVLKDKIFQWLHQIYVFLWLSPLWRWSGPYFVKFWIPFIQGWFVLNLIEIGILVEKNIYVLFSLNINTTKYGFPYCDPSWNPESIIWRNLNLHYVKKLSCKYELF